MLAARRLSLLASVLLLGTAAAQAAPFTAGNLVIYRVGDGAGAISGGVGNAVFLDEFTPTGTLVQSVSLSVGTGTNGFSAGNSGSEGMLSRSADGRFLVATGFGYEPGLAVPVTTPPTGLLTAPSISRVVAVVGANGVADTSTRLTDVNSTSRPFTAASTDGNDLWIGGLGGTTGTNGVQYARRGDTTATQISATPTAVRALTIAGGQLYLSSITAGVPSRIAAVGTGTPTAAASVTALTGIPATGINPNQFVLLDLNAGVEGVDTLYYADNSTGIAKYSLVGGTWTANGVIAVTGLAENTARGLTAAISGSTVNLFGTTEANFFSISDASGYNVSISGSVTARATAGTNTQFRGIAFAPAAAGAAAPEPSADLLLGAGVAASSLIGAIRRRRKAA